MSASTHDEAPGMSASVALPAPARSRPWARALGMVFGLAVVGLLAWAAQKVDWPKVWQSLRDLPPATLMAALAAAVASHLVYATYDLLGRAWTGHRLPWPRVMQITFVSYAFNLNLGTWIGGFAFRFRLYSRLGLDKARIGQVLALSLTTNWLGYGLLAGGLFLLRLLAPPPDWTFSAAALQWLGGLMWLLVAAYLMLCVFAGQRSFTLHGRQLSVPTWRMALLQLTSSSLNWLIMASVVWLLLQRGLPYPQVLAALLVAAMAGVVTHIPAGIGVLETVFVALLTPELPQPTLLAALLAYRGIYYLVPLVVATVMYFTLEAKAGKAF